MIKIFKDNASKTCILDDFGFYEKRQKIIQEKKTKQQQFQKQAKLALLASFLLFSLLFVTLLDWLACDNSSFLLFGPSTFPLQIQTILDIFSLLNHRCWMESLKMRRKKW